MLTHYFQHSLGQESLLQKSLWTSLPSHLLPPYWGAGSEQSLVLCLAPPPQDTEQALQLVQVAHLPSTGLKKNICALLLLRNDQVKPCALIGWVMILLILSLFFKFLFCIGVWTAKGLSHTYTCIHSPPDSPPIQAATQHWAEFPVLCSRTVLVIHFKYSSVYVWHWFLTTYYLDKT